MNEVQQKLVKLTAEHLGLKEEEISLDADFNNDLGADSLGLTELMMAIEEEFNCEISDEEAAKISTVAQAAKYLEEKKLSTKEG